MCSKKDVCSRVSITFKGELNDWKSTPLTLRINSVLGLTEAERRAAENNSLPVGLSTNTEMLIPEGLPFDEQQKLIQTYSRLMIEEQAAARQESRRENVPEPEEIEITDDEDEDDDDYDEMIKKALALSLDPSEQHNQEVQNLVRAVKESSQNVNSNVYQEPIPTSMSSATVPAATNVSQFPPLSESDQLAYDEGLARALEVSRQDFAKSQIKKYLDDAKAIQQLNCFKGMPRPIVVDGNNVAYNHSNHKHYSVKAMALIVDYFNDRGHKDVTIFCTPVHANKIVSDHDRAIYKHFVDAGILKVITKRRIGDEVIGHYDGLYILKTAKANGGIVISNDKFRDVTVKYPNLADTIKYNVLPFQFVNDHFIPAEDPLGRRGPSLSEFLKF